MKGKNNMKYNLVKRTKMNYIDDQLTIVKVASSLDQALKYKVANDMLEESDENVSFEVCIRIDDVFEYMDLQGYVGESEALAEKIRTEQSEADLN